MMSTDKDQAVFVALENGILKEIKHRTNDVINDITRRINETLREIVQSVTDSAKDLEECIKQDILEAKPDIEKNNGYKKGVNLNTNSSDNGKVKVGIKELKQWREKINNNLIINKHVTFKSSSISNDPLVKSSSNVKIGMKELKEWKKKKELKNASLDDEIVYIKEENEFENVDINEPIVGQYLSLEDYMTNDINEDQLDRYTKPCNPSDIDPVTILKEEDLGDDRDADFEAQESKVKKISERQSRKVRKIGDKEEEYFPDSDSDSLETTTSKQRRGKYIKDKTVKKEIDINGNNKFSCTQCSYTHRHNSMLRRHIEDAHEKPIKCSECDYATGRRIKLLYHIRGKHQAKNDFKCTFTSCSFTTSYKESFNRHIRTVHK